MRTDSPTETSTVRLAGRKSLRLFSSSVVVRSDIDDLHTYLLRHDAVDDAVLPIQTGRSVAAPAPAQRFIAKSPDHPYSLRPGEHHEILPLMVTVQDIDRELSEFLL